MTPETLAAIHECGCATFGPGPHPVDARHPNVRGCEHAEDGLRKAWDKDMTQTEIDRIAVALAEGDFRNWSARDVAVMISGPIRAIAAARLGAALQAEPARAEEGEGTP